LRSVLFIDGYAKGHVIPCDEKAYVWRVAIPHEPLITEYDPDEPIPTLRTEDYYFHMIGFYGLVIQIASIHMNYGNIDPHDMQIVLSRGAKQAAVEMPARGGSGRNPVQRVYQQKK
jgi:hypothetical protein